MTSSAGYAAVHETHRGQGLHRHRWRLGRVLGGRDPINDEKIIINMGPQHPSTHGVLRLVLELEGETVTEARTVIGYLHTGIEKNLEYRNWTQGTTFVTRMDYLSPIFNETAYCLAVEKLLGITDEIPERANVIRVLMMELNRISSHLVWVATTGMELGALSIMTLRLPGAREDPRHLRDGLRAADEHGVRPPRRRGAGLPGGGGQEDPGVPRRACPSGWTSTRTAVGQPDLAGAHDRRGRAGRHRLPGAGRHRPGAAQRRTALGPAQDHAVLRLRELRVRRPDPRRRGRVRAATRSAWRRCASR